MAMTRTVLSMDRPGSSASTSGRPNGAGRVNVTSTNMAYSSSYGGTSGDYSNDDSLSPLSRKKSSQSPSKVSIHQFDSNRRATLTQSHCAFCLVAEFDIDKGSTLSHQYPSTIDYDDHLLAELMLPDGVHARSEDWTVFFLPAQAVPERKSLSGSYNTSQRFSNSSKGKERNRDDLYYVLNLVRTKHDNSVRRGALVKAIAVGSRHPFIQIFKPALLLALDDYFKSPSSDVLARLYESLNTLDFSCMPQLNRNEKLILRAAERRDLFEERFKEVTPTRTPSNLRHLTNMNDEDEEDPASSRSRSESTSTTQSSVAEEAMKVTSSSVIGSTAGRSTSQLPHRPSLASLRPGNSAASMMKRRPSAANQLQLQQTNDLNGSHISLPSVSGYRGTNGTIMSPMTSIQDGKMRDTHYWETSVTYGKIQDLPIRIPTDTFPEEIGEYSLIELMTTFASSTPIGPLHAHLHSNGQLTPAVILLFNAVVTCKRIVFLGHNQPASRVALHVLSACALGSGCGVAWKGIAKRCYPYANLGIIDELEKVPGFIAGVTNPRFEDLPVWDLLFNIENGKVIICKDIEIPPPFSPGHTRPSMAQSQSSGSMGSSFGHGLDGETKLSTRAPTETDTISNGISNIGMSAGGTIRGRDRSGTVLEAKVDSSDTLFIEELSSAITARYGERYIRSRWTDWAFNFLRQVGRHEEHFYGETTSQPFLNGQLGSGLISGNREQEMKEIQACALRIEAFRASDVYRLCRQDELDRDSNRSITGFDLSHQLARLRRARNMSLREGELIFATIARAVQTSDQIVELLAHLPLHQGGLSSISGGLFHPSSAARIAIQDLLVRFTMHPIGKKFVQSLNLYHRLAFARSLHEANEIQQGSLMMNSNNPTPNSAQQPFTSTTAPSSTATQSKYGITDLPKDGLPSGSNGSNGLGNSFASQCSHEGMPITDVLSSSLSNYSRSASPANF